MIAFSPCARARNDARRDRFARHASSLRRICAERTPRALRDSVARLARWTAICTVRRRGLAVNTSSIERCSIVDVSAGGRAARDGGGRAGRGRWFADRPVAWHEHDDADVPAAARAQPPADAGAALTFRDSVANEADRILSLEGRPPAQDVNAARRGAVLDLVLRAQPPPADERRRDRRRPGGAAAAAAADDRQGQGSRAPRPATRSRTRTGRKYMLKFDAAGHPGMANAGEMIGNRIFHAAGYNVPGAFVARSRPRRSEARARARPSSSIGVQKRPLTEAHVRRALAKVARLPDGRMRAVAVPWIPGSSWAASTCWACAPTIPTTASRTSIAGRCARAGCCSPGCRCSIRARSTPSTATSRRRAGTSSATTSSTSAARSARRPRTRRACSRPANIWSRSAARWPRCSRSGSTGGRSRTSATSGRGDRARIPSLGYFPAESFDPDALPHQPQAPRRTCGSPIATRTGAPSWSPRSRDEQIAAMVATARLPDADARYLDGALRVRRDIIGRRYLRAIAAVETPSCRRTAAASASTTWRCARLRAARGGPLRGRGQRRAGRRGSRPEQEAAGPAACVPFGGTDRGHRLSRRGDQGPLRRRGGTRGGHSARRPASTCAGATARAASSSSDWSVTNDRRGRVSRS